jgi:hypothetical protein
MKGDRERAAMRIEMAERVEEAWDTLRRMPDKERNLLLRGERGQTWPLIIHSAAEHAAWKPVKIRRPPATARQIDRMEQVMDWLLGLSKQERDFAKAVWLCCAMRRKPAEAAKLLGCHRDTARVWRDNGLDRMVSLTGYRCTA